MSVRYAIEDLPEGSRDAEDAVTRRVLRAFDEAGEVASFLDAGCGEGKYILRLRGKRPVLRAWAVDGHAPSLREAVAERKILGMLPGALAEVEDGAVDAAVAIDVVEHLEQSDALELLRELERVSRRCVVVFTPLGFMEHPGTDANPLLRHLSGWESGDFEALGYRTAVWEAFNYGLVPTPYAPALWAWKVKS